MCVSVAFDKIRRVIDAMDCDAGRPVFFFYRLFRGNTQRYRAPGKFVKARTLFSEVTMALSAFLGDELTYIVRAHISREELLAEIEEEFELCVWYTTPTHELVVLTSTDDPSRRKSMVDDVPHNGRVADEIVAEGFSTTSLPAEDAYYLSDS